jgi:PAS domain S-box-containing protein
VFAAARDVTDRKKAEAAVQAERKRLFDVLETMPAMICLLTPDYHIVFANRSFREKFGESNGRRCYEYCFGQKEPCKFCESFIPFKTGQPHHWEVNGPDGSVIDAYDYPFTDVDGSPLVLEMDIDITPRKRAEEQLRAASLYSRSLLEASLDPLVTISAKGKVTDVNKATEEATGCTREELIGSDFSDYFTEPEEAQKGYQQVFSEGFVKDYPLAIRHKSGKITDVLYNATVYRNERGQIQGVFAAARDVTEQKRAEEKLRVASRYARTLLEASLDPLVTISAEGKITDVNQATEFVTGLSREQLIGSDFSDYFTEPEQARKGYQQVFREGYVTDYPLAIRNTSGKITDVLYNATLFTNEADEVQGVFAAARDITQRKAMENELRNTLEKLKQSNAELEQFAYVASHDLQEPLRMVASYVQLLERRYKGKLDSDADEFIAYAVDGANRMRGLIDDLLTYSRVGRLGKPFEPTNLETTLDIVLMNLKASIQESHANVTHDKLPVLNADGGQLVQLFQNLIGNAIKFHGEEAPCVHLSVKDRGAEFQFAVRDNGIGIDPQYFDRLFRIFQRLHTREEYPGSGIGLAVCKKIVERHGGRIWIESRVGKGSTIYFTLSKRNT